MATITSRRSLLQSLRRPLVIVPGVALVLFSAWFALAYLLGLPSPRVAITNSYDPISVSSTWLSAATTGDRGTVALLTDNGRAWHSGPDTDAEVRELTRAARGGEPSHGRLHELRPVAIARSGDFATVYTDMVFDSWTVCYTLQLWRTSKGLYIATQFGLRPEGPACAGYLSLLHENGLDSELDLVYLD